MTTLHLKNHRIDRARLKDWLVKDGGETLLLFLDAPREVVRVRGGGDVSLAVLEIQRAADEGDDGQGWATASGE